MSDMKCPICQTTLDKAFLSDKVRGCPKCKNIGNIDLWQELIRTRKALDVALDWLEQVATPEKCDDDLCCEFTKRKLTEINTALEQKE